MMGLEMRFLRMVMCSLDMQEHRQLKSFSLQKMFLYSHQDLQSINQLVLIVVVARIRQLVGQGYFQLFQMTLMKRVCQ